MLQIINSVHTGLIAKEFQKVKNLMTFLALFSNCVFTTLYITDLLPLCVGFLLSSQTVFLDIIITSPMSTIVFLYKNSYKVSD